MKPYPLNVVVIDSSCGRPTVIARFDLYRYAEFFVERMVKEFPSVNLKIVDRRRKIELGGAA